MRPVIKDYLKHKFGPRAPVFTPGSLFSSPLPEVMTLGSISRESLRDSPMEIARYAKLYAEMTGVDSLGLPSVMTIESEAYGGETEDMRPGEEFNYPFSSVEEFSSIKTIELKSFGRAPIVLEAITAIKKEAGGRPVIADVAGALGLATSVMDAKELLKSLVRKKEESRAFLDGLASNTCVLAGSAVNAGADIVCVMEPFASYLAVSPGFFSEFAVGPLNAVSAAIRRFGAYSMLHICGDIISLNEELCALDYDIISVDNSVDLRGIGRFLPVCAVGGNVCAETIASGKEGAVKNAVERALSSGVDIIMPSCGISGRVIPGIRKMTGLVP